jgi:hypothetical protein
LSEQLQLRRGTAAQVTAFTGAAGEVVMDTTNNRLVVNDGVTVGGAPLAKLSEVITNGRTAVSDAAYTALAADRLIAYTALTAARVVTLPASSAYPTGTQLLVVDETGACSVTKTITVRAAGSDTINGQAAAVVNIPYGRIALECNAGGAWTVVEAGFAAALKTEAASPNGATLQFGIIEFLQSGLSGASVTCATQIPADCLVFAVGVRVVTTIAGPTSYEVGESGLPTEFGSGLSLPAGSNNFGLIGPKAYYTPTNIILTATGGNFTAGAVRVSISYMLANPPAA